MIFGGGAAGGRAGALEAGADEVIVADVHGSGFNFIIEELHPDAKYVFGANASTRFPFLDETTDLGFLLGYHAMAGTEAAILDHTYSSAAVSRYVVNGIEMGEIAVDALRFGYYGIPVGLVTGDRKACEEAVRFLGNIETAVVKEAVARQGAIILSPKKGRELIRQAAYNAVKRVAEFKPYMIPGPYNVEVEYVSTDHADSRYVNGKDKVRVGPRTVLYKTDSVLDLFLTTP